MTRKPAPTRTAQQRADALKWANVVRSTRADLKVRLKRDAGPRRTLLVLAINNDTEALGLPERSLDTMKVFDLLIHSPKLGRSKVNRTFLALRISPSKTVAGLSERQRTELTNAVTAIPNRGAWLNEVERVSAARMALGENA